MIAYGASRFALAYGDQAIAKELWPLIEWCLEFSNRKLNDGGVVMSDTDELEGRFPTGDANLCTSSLYYDALIYAAALGKQLGITKAKINRYKKQTTALKSSIEKYFGINVMSFDTYQYYAGNTKLRSWISIPLTVDIFDRKEATIDALFSPQLWTDDGIATESGDMTFWDRATLYGLRGTFAAGETKRGLEFLKYYSKRRLLGEHVPYPVEAYPEGGQRHLSAESGLYCRVYTEGLFGIRPIGLNSFKLTPQLPAEWNEMSLTNIHAFGKVFDIEIERIGQKLQISILINGQTFEQKKIHSGNSLVIRF